MDSWSTSSETLSSSGDGRARRSHVEATSGASVAVLHSNEILVKTTKFFQVYAFREARHSGGSIGEAVMSKDVTE